jgi:putative ABC transport system permease protein
VPQDLQTAVPRLRRLSPSVGFVPLAWRNLVSDRPRLLRSAGGIAFAVLLMLMQLGFERAFFNASLDLLRLLDGDIFLQSASKYRFATRDPFAGRELDAARSVPGVASAWPLYAAWIDVFWKNPSDGKTSLVRTLGFDPDQPVLRLPKVEGNPEQLHEPDTVLVDRDARKFLGMDPVPSQSELNGLTVRVVGSFGLGPNFESDGTVVVGDRTFARLLPGPGGGPPGVELGVIKLRPGFELAAVQDAIRAKLPPAIAVMTKDQLLELERNFQADVSSAGPIFAMGTLVGFVVGMLIAYQIIYTDLSEQLPQYATMKAIGYRTRYLVSVVLEQAAFTGLAGWIPAWLLSLLLYRVVGAVALLPMRMTWNLALTSLVLTLGMCLISAIIAVRRVIALDPAEVF